MLVPVTEVDFGEERLVARSSAFVRRVSGLHRRDRGGQSGWRRANRPGRSPLRRPRPGRGRSAPPAPRSSSEPRPRGGMADRAAAATSNGDCRPSCAGAIFAPGDGQVDPRALVDALEVTAQRAGVRIVTGRRGRPARRSSTIASAVSTPQTVSATRRITSWSRPAHGRAKPRGSRSRPARPFARSGGRSCTSPARLGSSRGSGAHAMGVRRPAPERAGRHWCGRSRSEAST
jgi:glycine/D-amino acid oxidase-like deaminating enzyme